MVIGFCNVFKLKINEESSNFTEVLKMFVY